METRITLTASLLFILTLFVVACGDVDEPEVVTTSDNMASLEVERAPRAYWRYVTAEDVKRAKAVRDLRAKDQPFVPIINNSAFALDLASKVIDGPSNLYSDMLDTRLESGRQTILMIALDGELDERECGELTDEMSADLPEEFHERYCGAIQIKTSVAPGEDAELERYVDGRIVYLLK